MQTQYELTDNKIRLEIIKSRVLTVISSLWLGLLDTIIFLIFLICEVGVVQKLLLLSWGATSKLHAKLYATTARNCNNNWSSNSLHFTNNSLFYQSFTLLVTACTIRSTKENMLFIN